MKTYKTYQEAKIANPDSEIAIVSRADEYTPPRGEFIAVIANDDNRDGFFFSDKSKSGWPNIRDGYYTICDPADYCMTVAEFLGAGNRFVAGDLIIHRDEGFMSIPDYAEDIWDKPSKDGEDSLSYILRAAALDTPKRTKTEYVKVNSMFNVNKEELENGEFYRKDKKGEYRAIVSEDGLLSNMLARNLYRKVETEMTERDVFIEEACKITEDEHGERRQYIVESLYDSGKFKLVEN